MDGALSRGARALARGQGLLLRGALGMPAPLRRALRGASVSRDGLRLDPDAQLVLRMQALARPPELRTLTPAEARRRVAADVLAAAGPRRRAVAVASTRDVGLADGVSGRLYVPFDAGPGLLVYFHGGGFVVGSVAWWDTAVRALAAASGVRVLSVDYRLAPEHRFPAAAEDAWAAWCAAVARASEFGATRVAVGGDSAGGNLAAGVALRAASAGGPAPHLQLLIYPWLELVGRSASRIAFAEGFYLTDEDLRWYASHYLGPDGDAADPRASPLRAASVAGVAPAYIATAGFDTLRDEGEAYADRLREAGVPVVVRRHAGLVHGYFNLAAVVPAAHDALAHAAGALALGLAAPWSV